MKDVLQYIPGGQAGVREELEGKRDDLVENYMRERDELLEDLLPAVSVSISARIVATVKIYL